VPGLISAVFQWTGSTPARFHATFRVIYYIPRFPCYITCITSQDFLLRYSIIFSNYTYYYISTHCNTLQHILQHTLQHALRHATCVYYIPCIVLQDFLNILVVLYPKISLCVILSYFCYMYECMSNTDVWMYEQYRCMNVCAIQIIRLMSSFGGSSTNTSKK